MTDYLEKVMTEFLQDQEEKLQVELGGMEISDYIDHVMDDALIWCKDWMRYAPIEP